MAESHQPFAAIELGADHRFGALGSADLEHHVERRTGRAAMQRALERADGAGDRGDDVGSRGDDDAGGEGGGVETVVADRIEIGLQRAGAFADGSVPDN